MMIVVVRSRGWRWGQSRHIIVCRIPRWCFDRGWFLPPIAQIWLILLKCRRRRRRLAPLWRQLWHILILLMMMMLLLMLCGKYEWVTLEQSFVLRRHPSRLHPTVWPLIRYHSRCFITAIRNELYKIGPFLALIDLIWGLGEDRGRLDARVKRGLLMVLLWSVSCSSFLRLEQITFWISLLKWTEVFSLLASWGMTSLTFSIELFRALISHSLLKVDEIICLHVHDC